MNLYIFNGGLEGKLLMKHYAVIGYPLTYTFSPIIHNYWMKNYKISGNYKAIVIDEHDFANNFHKIINEDHRLIGFNVTIPHKQDVMRYLDCISDDAESIGAVNTVKIDEDGKMLGFNTDYLALYDDFSKLISINSNILLIGAGGASRAAIVALQKLHCNNIFIFNKTAEKAKILAEEFQISYLDKINQEFDLIINSTPASFAEISDLMHAERCISSIFYDMKYGRDELDVNKFEERFANYIDGISMLIKQASFSFEIWHGMMPEITGIQERLAIQQRL